MNQQLQFETIEAEMQQREHAAKLEKVRQGFIAEIAKVGRPEGACFFIEPYQILEIGRDFFIDSLQQTQVAAAYIERSVRRDHATEGYATGGRSGIFVFSPKADYDDISEAYEWVEEQATMMSGNWDVSSTTLVLDGVCYQRDETQQVVPLV